MMCTFEVGLVQLLIEMLLPLVVELDFVIYTESDGIGCSLRVLLLASFDLQSTTVPGPPQMCTSLLRIAATTPGLIFRILNSMFF